MSASRALVSSRTLLAASFRNPPRLQLIASERDVVRNCNNRLCEAGPFKSRDVKQLLGISVV